MSNQMQNNKMGFFAVISLVIGAQIGTGILILPATLAQYGGVSIIGLCIASFGSIFLALIFASLAHHMPGAGGPYAYVKKGMGFSAAFFTGWTYWLISWVSSIAVIVSAIAYLKPIMPYDNPFIDLFLEILLVFIITLVNINGTKFAGYCESILVIFKIVPFVIIPLLGIRYFDLDKFINAPINGSIYEAINYTGSNSLWLFIGLECATSAIGSVENPKKVIPLAVVIGTCIVAALYILNAIGIMSLISFQELAREHAPYSKAASILFGAGWDKALSLIAAIICFGTLNAWVLTSGQVALRAAKDKILPSFLGRVNNTGAPHVSLIISFIGTIPLLVMMLNHNIVDQLNFIIETSVSAFLFVYAISAAVFLKLIITGKIKASIISFVIGVLGFLYCVWSICITPIGILLPSFFFTLCSLPIYFYQKRIHKKSIKNNLNNE